MECSKCLFQISRIVAITALACGSAAGVGLACYQLRALPQWAATAGAAGKPVAAASASNAAARLPDGSYPAGPLAAGTAVPLMEAGGWINGAPSPLDQAKPRLVVLDIWSHWCMACRQTAPGLVRLQRKFANQQVSFVSLTNVDRQQVEQFASQANISWPCGYGASLKSLSSFGAYNPDRFLKNAPPGYEVTPTLYVIGADGRVLWHDEQGRPRHLKDSNTIVQELEAEIERLLTLES